MNADIVTALCTCMTMHQNLMAKLQDLLLKLQGPLQPLILPLPSATERNLIVQTPPDQMFELGKSNKCTVCMHMLVSINLNDLPVEYGHNVHKFKRVVAACGTRGRLLQSSVTSEDDSEDTCRRKTSSSFRICEVCMSKNYWDHELCRLRVAPDAVPILKNFVIDKIYYLMKLMDENMWLDIHSHRKKDRTGNPYLVEKAMRRRVETGISPQPSAIEGEDAASIMQIGISVNQQEIPNELDIEYLLEQAASVAVHPSVDQQQISDHNDEESANLLYIFEDVDLDDDDWNRLLQRTI